MAIIKKKEIKQLSEDKIVERLQALRKELVKINAQKSTGTIPENPGKIKEIKRTIAHLLFLLEDKKSKKPKEVNKKG